MRSYFTIVIGGGRETTRNAAAVGLWQFMQNPDQKKLLLDDPSLTNSAVDEVLHWITPARSRFRGLGGLRLHGKLIRTGDWVVGCQAPANKDERKFEEPRRFDITRDASGRLSLGEGIHLCLGRAVARPELATLIPNVLRAFPDMKPAQEPQCIAENTPPAGSAACPCATYRTCSLSSKTKEELPCLQRVTSPTADWYRRSRQEVEGNEGRYMWQSATVFRESRVNAALSCRAQLATCTWTAGGPPSSARRPGRRGPAGIDRRPARRQPTRLPD